MMLAFPFGMLRNFMEHNNACFDFWNVAKLYGLRKNACFEGLEGNKQGFKADRKCPRMKLGYDSCPSLLVFYWR